MPTDKLIIANRSAMQTKYGPAGLASVQAALQRLLQADAGRGLQTRILYIDDTVQMTAVGGVPVVAPSDERGAKAAVDAAFIALDPDYVVLLDGPDVVPHITLNAIAGLNDGDANIPSDLPYASNAGWSRQASSYLSITRVVGRIPAAEGDPDANNLARLIDAAAAHQPRTASHFQRPFAMSADVWQVSTQLSLSATFGPGTPLSVSPSDGHPAIDADLRRLAHFVNCHGAQADPRFYGQRGANYPVAMESSRVAPNISPGAVVAVECCYGAELYNHTLIAIDPPICISYLLNGGIAFLGSTNIAYGPASTNGQADLLTQYFLQEVLANSSTGAALLLARQKFVQGQVMASPTNLKTVAQFLLLGDPSILPCAVGQPPVHQLSIATTEAEAKSIVRSLSDQDVLAPDQNRKLRRMAMDGTGRAIGASATKPGQAVDIGPALRKRLAELARAQQIDPKEMTVLTTSGGPIYRSAAKATDVNRRVGIVVDRRDVDGTPGPFIKVVVAHMIDDRIVRMEVTESR